MPGLRGPPHQGLLPRLPRDRVERLRAPRGRGRAAGLRHRRLDDPLRPHRAWSRRSASVCAGCATSSRTRRSSSPTTPTCSPTPRSTTWSRRSGTRTPSPRCSPCPRRRSSTSWTSTRADRVNSIYPVTDMRMRENGGLLRAAPRGDRLHPRERRPRRRRLHEPREGGPPALLPLRRLLAARGHPQGAQRPRGRLPGRHAPLDGLGARAASARRWRASSTRPSAADGMRER